MGRSENDIKQLCPDATVRVGLAIRGGGVMQADKEIEAWIKQHAK